MKWKLNHPFLVIALGTALPMMVMLVWALLQTDRVVINQAFALFLPLLPILVTVYLVLNRRSTDPKPGWPRFALLWMGGNALGVSVATLLFALFHAFAFAEVDQGYNYSHFGFSSYLEGRQRQVVPGEKAVDEILYDLTGNTVQLSTLWKQNPIVVEYGNITCPVFVGKVTTMESLAEKYAGLIDFYVLYVREAHPGQNYPAHSNFRQKLSNAIDLQYEERIGRTILVDDIDGKMHLDYGALPNSVYLIGKDGVIAHRADWLAPDHLDQQIELLLAAGGEGAGMTPTSLTDNFTVVDQDMMATTIRVFVRAGFAAGADFFLSFPSMLGARSSTSP
jgi:peroxiredoxin